MRWQLMPIFIFSHYKSMASISCHSNQGSYRIGTKTILFVPPAYRCYMWSMVRIGLMASEEMFENTDGRMDADRPGRRMPGYTMSLRLRRAKICAQYSFQNLKNLMKESVVFKHLQRACICLDNDFNFLWNMVEKLQFPCIHIKKGS